VTTEPITIAENAEAIEAWDGPLYDRFVRFRDLVTAGHEALRAGLADMLTPEGVRGMASTWIVAATNQRK